MLRLLVHYQGVIKGIASGTITEQYLNESLFWLKCTRAYAFLPLALDCGTCVRDSSGVWRQPWAHVEFLDQPVLNFSMKNGGGVIEVTKDDGDLIKTAVAHAKLVTALVKAEADGRVSWDKETRSGFYEGTDYYSGLMEFLEQHGFHCPIRGWRDSDVTIPSYDFPYTRERLEVI